MYTATLKTGNTVDNKYRRYNFSTGMSSAGQWQSSSADFLSTVITDKPIPPAPHRISIGPSQPLPFSMDVGSRFGFRLRHLRKAKNMTQMDMAIAFGIDRSYISDIECGKKGVSLATLEVIALGFRIKLSHLLEDV
jgi:DNA-binding XRE family transcriptional regulator